MTARFQDSESCWCLSALYSINYFILLFAFSISDFSDS